MRDKEAEDVASSDYMTALADLLGEHESALSRAVFEGELVLISTSADVTYVTLTLTASTVDGPAARPSKNIFGELKRVATMSPQTEWLPETEDSSAEEEIAVAFLDHIISVIPTLHTRFARYEEMDLATLNHCIGVTLPTAPPTSAPEKALVDRNIVFDDQRDGDSPWKRIKGTVQSSVSYFEKKMSGHSAIGKAVAIVDTSAERCFAWLWNVDLYERNATFFKEEGDRAFRKVIEIPNSHSMISGFLITFLGLNNRLFPAWFAWHQYESGEILIAFAPPEECPDEKHVRSMDELIKQNEKAAKAIRGETRGFFKITPLAKNVCRLTLVTQGKLGGHVPVALLNARIKKTLSIVTTIQEKYARTGKVVDAELRSMFGAPPSLGQLNPQQEEVFMRCQVLETLDAEVGRENIHSHTPFVKMWIRRLPSKGMISVGISETVVDCSRTEALAWFFTMRSRDRNRTSSDDGDSARVLVKESSPHDVVFAIVKKMPYPLHKREFVTRMICASNVSTGELFLAVESVAGDIDYGASFKLVRGTIRASYRFIPISSFKCKVVVHQHFELGGFISYFETLRAVADSKMVYALSAVVSARSAFQRDGEIDKEERDDVARIIRHEPQIYTEYEREQIQNVSEILCNIPDADFKKLVSPAPQISLSGVQFHTENVLAGVARAIAVIDASVEECSAWEMNKTSRANMKRHAKSGGLERSSVKLNDHFCVTQVVYDTNFLSLSPREWVVSQIWEWKNSSTLEVYSGSIEHVDYPVRKKYVRAKSMMIYRYEKLADLRGTPQTLVTYIQYVDLMGNVPKWANSGRAVVRRMMFLNMMRANFDRSLEIDAASRGRIVDIIKKHTDAYTPEEKDILDEVGANLKLSECKLKKIKTASGMTEAGITFKQGDGHVWGLSKTVVRATPEEIVGFAWDVYKRAGFRADDLEKTVDEEPNDHNKLVYTRKETFKIVDDRDFCGRCIWKKISDSIFLLVCSPEKVNPRPTVLGTARGKICFAMRMTRMNENKTKLEYAQSIDFGGAIPLWIANTYVGANLAFVQEIQEYFQALRGLELWDEEDGKAIGELAVIRSEAENHREKGETNMDARLRELFKKQKGLKEIGMKYDFFQALMARLLLNQLRPTRDVYKKLAYLSAKNGAAIGSGLAVSLATNLTSDAAVDEWIRRYASMKELDQREVWFRPMINVIAKRLLGEVAWGMKFRVFTGAGLSMLDMASDLTMIAFYLATPEQEGYGKSLGFMILASICIQLVVVYAQNQSKSRKKIIKEILIVLTGLKPGYVHLLFIVLCHCFFFVFARYLTHTVLLVLTHFALPPGPRLKRGTRLIP
jgi:hypothetical protein